MDPAVGRRIVALRPRIIAHFDVGNWEEVGVLTGLWKTIEDHPRPLRSLSWKDSDYSGHVIPVLREMAGHDPGALDIMARCSGRCHTPQSSELDRPGTSP